MIHEDINGDRKSAELEMHDSFLNDATHPSSQQKDLDSPNDSFLNEAGNSYDRVFTSLSPFSLHSPPVAISVSHSPMLGKDVCENCIRSSKRELWMQKRLDEALELIGTLSQSLMNKRVEEKRK